MRRLRSRVGFAVGGLLVGVLALLSAGPTQAAWTDQEYGRATFTAGAINPPRTMVCAAFGLLTNARLSWTAPVAGGAVYTIYTYAIVPLSGSYPSASGTISAGSTTFTLPGTFLTVLGTGRFELRAHNPTTGWSSAPITATVGTTGVLGLSVTSSCSVP